MRQVVARRDHLPVTLSASFRNVPALIGWLNDRLERLLGTPPDGRPFDSDTGRVFHQPLGVPRVAEVLPLAVAVRTGGSRPARRPPGPARGQSAGRSPLAPLSLPGSILPRAMTLLMIVFPELVTFLPGAVIAR